MRVLSQRALLFGLTGFLEGDRHVESSRPETTIYQRQLWSLWWQERDKCLPDPQRLPHWKMSGSRPQNHPQRRLGGLARLAAARDDFADIAFNVKHTQTFLEGLQHSFWDRHYTLKAAPTAKPVAHIGRSRVHDILANQLIPLRLHSSPDLVWEAYSALPALLDNEKLRRATQRLFGEHPKATFTKHLYQQQALLQVYDDLCITDQSDCADCPFPEQAWKIAQNRKNGPSC